MFTDETKSNSAQVGSKSEVQVELNSFTGERFDLKALNDLEMKTSKKVVAVWYEIAEPTHYGGFGLCGHEVRRHPRVFLRPLNPLPLHANRDAGEIGYIEEFGAERTLDFESVESLTLRRDTTVVGGRSCQTRGDFCKTEYRPQGCLTETQTLSVCLFNGRA